MKGKDKFISDLNKKPIDLLISDLINYKNELFYLKCRKKSGQITDFSKIKKQKKDIARIKTFIKRIRLNNEG